MFLRKGLGSWLVVLCMIGLSTAWLPDLARATHYPEGASCLDCHATSGSKMVLGTKMIKASAATVALGMSSGQQAPCLFCHRAGAVSGLADSTIMKPVDGHFSSGVTSKHDSNYASAFEADVTNTIFTCLDCHPNAGLSTYVAYDNLTGDANVHNVDAKTQYIGGAARGAGSEAVRVAGVLASLVNTGTPPPSVDSLQNTCTASTCHDAGGSTVGGRTAKPLHTMGAGFTDCADCHATHRSEKQGSLVVLLKDGVSKDPQDGTAIPPSSIPSANDCTQCHSAIVATYDAKGHGQFSIKCEDCHTGSIPHSFATGGTPETSLRFGISVYSPSSTSALRKNVPYNSAYSVCASKCHTNYQGKLHGAAETVGCADCHEPHGIGVNTNIMMVRQVMAKTDVAGNPVYGQNSPTGTYETVTYTSASDNYRVDAAGLCDNAECHQGRTTAALDPLYPLGALMTGDNHTGGNIAAGGDCNTCHQHNDAAGSWGAASSCDGCHGNPPATNAHLTHTDPTTGASLGCDKCHPTPGTGATHKNTAGIANATDYSNLWSTTPATIRNNVDIAITGGSYSLAKGSRSSIATYGDCTTACHGSGLAAASQGSDLTPTWNVPTSGACGTCHKDMSANPFATGVHKQHAADRNIGCEVCHANTYTGTALKYPAHVNGSATGDVVLKAGSTFNSAAVTMTYATGSCSNISCHGGWNSVAWAAPASCANCHAYPPASAGVTNHDLTAPVDKTVAELKSAHGNCTTCHGVSAASDATPNSFGVPSDTTASGGDAYVIATNHIDGKVQMNGISGTNNNQSAEYDEVGNGCNKACHDNTYKITQIRANVVELKELGAGSCDGCHGGAGAFWPNTAGFVDNAGSQDDDAKHTVHMTALAQRVYGESLAVLITTTGNGAPDVKQKALCEYCHAAVTNDDGHTAGDDAEVFVTNIATVSTRKAKAMNGAADGDAAYAAGACSNVDCHNNKSTAPTYNWYTASNSACTMCHSVGGTNNPTSGIHNAARISANLHDDAFKITPTAPTDAGSCTTCHTMSTMASQSATHDNGGPLSSVVADMGLTGTAGLAYTQAVPGQGTCALSGGLAGCHSDGGAWQRIWNSTASASTGAECANCHGGLTTGYVAGTFATGVTQRHSDPQIPGNHGTCDYCHEYNNGSTTPYNLGTMHRDGNIQLNATVAADLGYTESGTAPNKRIGCSNCHSAVDDAAATYADGKHEFNMVTDGTRWTRANLDGAAYDCTSCHTANAATHLGTGESATVHSTHTNNTSWIANCQDCHSNSGPGTGTGHQDGTISFGGTRMTSAFNYTLASNNFTTATNCANAANGCHDAAGTTWTAPATITCDNCHNAGTAGTVDAGKIMDMGTPAAAPTTGSHAKHRTTTTGAGATCNDCHGANATTGTHTGHQNNLVTVSGASAGYTGSLDPRNTANGGTCGINTCHNNGQNAAAITPAYAWGTAIGTGDSCTECHDATTTLATQSHSAHNNAAATFGQTITCNSCHAAASAATHGNGTINFGGTFTFTYAGDVTVTANGGTFGGCSANTCHNAGYSSAAGTLATPKTSAYAWGTAIANCDACHQDAVGSMATGSHTNHLTTTTGAGAVCTDCHNAATSANHINGTVNMGGTIITLDATYTGTKLITEFPNAYGTCGVNSCHNNGKNAAALVPAYTWNTAIGAINSCTECHDATATLATQSHSAHNNAAATFGQTITCNNCHAAATVATHGNGTINLNGTTTFTYAGDVAVNGTTYGGCATNTCHNAGYSTGVGVLAAPKTSAYAWGTAIANCDACHQDAVGSMITGSHTNHLTTTTGAGAACNDCHNAATNANHINGTVNMGGTIVTADATYLGTKVITEFPNGYGGCGTNVCHNNGQNAAPLANTYSWNTAIGAINSCTECHDATATLATQAHSAHNNATATFGMTVTCGSCHAAATVATHGNGTVNFGGTVTFTYGIAADATVGTSGGTFASCGTNTCHNDGATAAPAVATYNWNTVQANCTVCHQDSTTMASNAHNEHMNAGYTGAACADCHSAATAATHINGQTNLAATVTYSKTAAFANDATASGTCLTASCHNKTAGVGQSAAWDTAGDLACDACHYWSATPTAVGASGYAGGGANAMSTSHGDHFTATKTCTQCHAAVTTTAHINGKTSLADGAVATYNGAGVGEAAAAFTDAAAVTDYTYNTSTHTCTAATNSGLGCHATGTTADWDVSFLTTACTNCHSDTTTAAVNPTSGLHGVVPSVTAEQHDSSFAGAAKGCVDCHNISTSITTHANGALNGDGSLAGDRTAMMFQNFTYANIANDSGTCTGTATGCHDTTRNTWAHKWMAPANYTASPAACTGCHGNLASGFNAGVDHLVGQIATDHPDTGTTNNYGCETCHALQAATGVYPFTFGTADWAPLNAGNKHGDALITMNDDGTGTITNWQRGTAGNSTKSMCVTCHTNWADTAPQHWFVNTTWTPAEVAGDAVVVACGACHTGGVTPSSASGAHAAHGVDSADLVAGGAACVDCHGNNGGSNYQTTLAGTHGIGGSVNFANVTYSMAGTRGNLTGTCLTANCHNVNTGTDQSTAWNTTALACDDCHYYAAGTTATSAGLTAYPATRRLSDDHGVHFGTGGTTFSQCSTCHGTDPIAGDTTHINGATTLTDKAVAAQDEANVTVLTWNDTTNNCANTSCHNPSATTYSATWQTSTGSCDLCHSSTNPTTGDHTEHMTGGGTFGRAIACVDCHNNTGYVNRHMSGSKNVQVRNPTTGVFGAAIATPTTAGACGTNECHNDGLGGAPLASTYQWGNAVTITNCLECHQNGATMATNSHNEHMNATPVYTGAACVDCHTAANDVTRHMNRSLNVDVAKVTLSGATAGAVALATVNGTCLTANCHNKTVSAVQSAAWNTAGDLACDACHYWSATPTAVGASGYAGGGANAMSTSHGDHFTATKTCTQCHAAVTTTAHINGRTSLADGAVATYNGAGVGEAAAAFTDPAAVTDYTYNTSTHTCTAATNSGLGCHATGSPDWDTAFPTTNCTDCHTDTTTAAVNPTSGLHSVVPTVSGQQHNQSVTGGCVACHSSMPAVPGTHMGGTFTGSGAVAQDRTNMGLFAAFTTSGTDNSGTCVGTAAGCHDTTRNTWQHKWDSTAGYYTTSPSACAGCHGINAGTGFNTGVDHKATSSMASTHGGSGSYDCQECHMMEYNAGNPYVFAFGTNDWGGTSKHGNGTIEINSKGNYDDVTNRWCAACHSTATYQFVDTTWPVDKTLAGPDFSGCNVCHGSPATGQYWPNGTPGSSETPPASATYDYADNSTGAHQTHIDAIGSVRGWTTVAQKNNTCNYCHPNPGAARTGSTDAGDHKNNTVTVGIVDVYQDGRVAGETQYFKTLAGANDGDLATATYNPTTKVCSNIDCHGDITTPAWLDTVGPVFSPNNTITVTNPASDGDLSISWNAATDAQSSPVNYDLYRHTAAGDACTLGTTIATNLGSLGYIDSGRTNGTTYYYCVKAKDSVANTTSTTTASAAPTAPAPVNTTYYLTRRNTGTIYGATSFNTPACSSTGTAAAATTTPATIPYIMRGGLDTSLQCGTVSVNNYVSNSSPSNGGGTTFENMLAFYTPAFASATTVTGAATGSSLYMRGSSGTEDVRLWLAAMATDGTLTVSASSANLANIGTTVTTAKAPSLSALTVNVPAGGRLALLYTWSDIDTTASTNDRLLFDNYSATEQSRIVVSMPATDSTAPTYTSTSLVATDAGTSGSVNLTWTAATDASAPIHYDVYASTSNVPATLFATANQSGISTNSTTVTGLVNGTTYYFGVRASDAFNNTDTNTFVSAGVAPTAGAGGVSCDTCHGMPPATGAHLVHSTSSVNDCNKCHGNTTFQPSTAYTNGYTPSIHGDGTRNMWFQRKADGSASGDTDAAWGGTTCTNVNCHFNVVTPNWVGGSTTCSSCHAFPPVAASGTVDHDANLTVAPATLANFLSSHGGCETCHGATSSNGLDTGTFTTNANYPAGSHGDGIIRMNGPDATPGPAAGTEYDDATGGCNKACHVNNGAYVMALSPTRTVNYGDFGAGDCAGCHDNAGKAATVPQVTATSSHVDADGAGTTYTAGACEDCHPFHADGTTGVNDVEISTQRTTPVAGTVPSMNWSYSTHASGKISLGGAATAGYAKSTEAEICWACHDARGVSEWGVNNNTKTGSIAYNYGKLTTGLAVDTATSNWTTGYWRSAKSAAAENTSLFGYKSGLITSTHSVNFNSGTAAVVATNIGGYRYGSATLPDNNTTTRKETIDAVANIRCSYCHDVHGTHNGVGGDTSGGAGTLDQPYLRGTWKGNPYPEDGAPRSGWTAWTNNTNYGLVPRASASPTNNGLAGQTNLGAFWIDQNITTNTNAGLDNLAGANSTSGLCALCHGGLNDAGDVNGTWTAARLDALDYVNETTASLWVGQAAGGKNGHANVVLGGSGVVAGDTNNNIFSRTKRGSASRSAFNTTDKYNVDMGVGTWSAGTSSEGGYSYRGSDSLALAPAVSRPYGWGKFAWNAAYNTGTPTAGSIITAGTPQLDVGGMGTAVVGTTTAHTETNFAPQSKYHTFNCGKCHNPHASRLPKLMITNCLDTNHNTWDDVQGGKATAATAPWTNSRDSQWPSAQNCHRLDDRAVLSTGSAVTRGTGWNRVTPWVETLTPDP